MTKQQGNIDLFGNTINIDLFGNLSYNSKNIIEEAKYFFEENQDFLSIDEYLVYPLSKVDKIVRVLSFPITSYYLRGIVSELFVFDCFRGDDRVFFLVEYSFLDESVFIKEVKIKNVDNKLDIYFPDRKSIEEVSFQPISEFNIDLLHPHKYQVTLLVLSVLKKEFSNGGYILPNSEKYYRFISIDGIMVEIAMPITRFYAHNPYIKILQKQ